ncbi:PDI 1-4 [Trifolium repens]|jgi:hypothetical protein|nr:PDI 1-4 [Trifolium repens]
MAIVAYFFSKEIWDSDAVIVAAVLIVICPCYISKLVVGEQDFTCSSKGKSKKWSLRNQSLTMTTPRCIEFNQDESIFPDYIGEIMIRVVVAVMVGDGFIIIWFVVGLVV